MFQPPPVPNQAENPQLNNPSAPPPNTITPVNPIVPDILKNAPMVNPLAENSRLMHPKEDLSMVSYSIAM